MLNLEKYLYSTVTDLARLRGSYGRFRRWWRGTHSVERFDDFNAVAKIR